MGNSEVGHINIGSGRVVPQGLVVIDAAIADGAFATNATLAACIAARAGERRHAAPVGFALGRRVHSSLDHLVALIDAAVAAHVPLGDRLLSRRPRYAAARAHSLRRRSRSKTRRARRAGPHHQHLRPLLRDGSRQALGAHRESVRHAHRRRSAPRRDGAEALAAAYARDENDEFVLPTTVGAAATDRRRRCGDLLQLSPRSRRANSRWRFPTPHFNHFTARHFTEPDRSRR